MSDLLTAARTQIEYARREIKAGTPDQATDHLDKADAFVARASSPTIAKVTEDEQNAAEDAAEWSGTFKEAYARFIEGADELLIAQGKPAGHDGEERGSLTRKECIDLATSLGVLDELGGPNFFGPELPGGLT